MSDLKRKHALLSASGAKRWMNCTLSARLEEQLPDKVSIFAEEGTFMHQLGELQLNYYLHKLGRSEFINLLEKYKENKFYSTEVYEAVQMYVNLVIEQIDEAKSKTKDTIVSIEQQVDFSKWVIEGFGTSDVIIISDGILHVIDLKGGQGVRVNAEDNPQLRLYGLGAYEAYDMLYDIRQVRMTIIQPRLDHISTSELVIEDLLEWAENKVKPKALLAFNGEGAFKSGDHCKFCKAKATCRARAKEQLELMKYEFQSPDLFTDEELGELLAKVGKLIDWAKDISDYMYAEALKGKCYEGWKLVEGRSTRKYTDTIDVAAALTTSGYDEALIYEKNLLTITAMEKAIGKKTFNELVGHLTHKPVGKPVLTPADDKRVEINTLQCIKDSL